jgi:hypothetical protein
MPSSPLAERFLVAVDLWEAGVTMQRQRLRRLHPRATAEEIETLLNKWLQERPGAAQGDGPQRSDDERPR